MLKIESTKKGIIKLIVEDMEKEEALNVIKRAMEIILEKFGEGGEELDTKYIC